ncbi:hypothetical protein ACQKB2_18150 [Mycobacterium tuberculosis]
MFEDEIARIADDRSDVVGLTAAMRLPTGLSALSGVPASGVRFGIAEQHLLASAAGLAAAGTIPLSRCTRRFCRADQLLFDIGLHRLPVTLVLDRAGNRARGPSHHGLWDLALLACVPGFQIACPRGASATTTVACRDRDRGSHRRAFPQGRRANRSRPNTPSVASTSCNTTTALATRRALGRSGCHESTMHGRRPVPQRGAAIRVTVVDPQWVWPISPALTELAGPIESPCVEDAIADVGIGAHLSHQSGGHTRGRAPTHWDCHRPTFPTPAATTSFPATDSQSA